MTLPERVAAHVRYDPDIAFRARARVIAEFLDPLPDDLVLDAGCGLGFHLWWLHALTQARLVGLELDGGRLAEAASIGGGISFVKGDLLRLPFPDSTFDKLLCSEVLEHLDDDLPAARELFRVLKPGGTAVITVPHHQYPFLWDPLNWARERLGRGHFGREPWSGIWTDHRRLYSSDGMASLLVSSGFGVGEVRLLTRWSTPFAHMLVYGPRRFAPSAPGGPRRAAFWRAAERSRVLRTAVRGFTAADALNRASYTNGPAVSLCVRATRPR